jgi:signal transduction histidine kinase
VQLALWVEDDRLQIRVEDTGPGFAPEDVERAFERGWTTKESAGASPKGLGRGLGLALAAQAVARNDGSIHVRPGPGAEFRVSLPLRVPVRATP